ncbi:uncharacterized protein LOC123264434 isoform X3 [Cotesia glomerata]|uniref:Peptidase S1 domain-containing protein n=1 Tax=Cotesia glomerata TaxID=32391 RepID=A0AAV7IPH1_COTGL|nr:uncharacterized protein LOC123264434 isoform X3 [Cotesia glomerata]KAH0554496.1 hypothetical protein KQX54_010999 [Cotesia glomerata]
MNYLKLWKVKVLISFLILIESCLCCQVLTDRSIKEVLEENYKSPWLVLIVDVTLGPIKTPGLAAPAYGSLIHQRLVLTAGYPLANSQPKNLEVWADCREENGRRTCITEKVLWIVDSSKTKKKEKTIEDWDVLMLDEPFVLSDRINVIGLANSDDNYDKTCQIYHWQIVATFDHLPQGPIKRDAVLHFSYNVTLNNDEFKVTEEGIIQMNDDLDCLIEPCFDYTANIPTKRISFMGSPIVCQHEDGRPLQVGFATIVTEVLGNEGDQQARIQKGSFVRLLDDTEKYLNPIIDIQANE